MPVMKKKLSLDLYIALEGGQRCYVPGDTIVGRVQRKFPVTCPSAAVTVSLFGRAATIAPGSKTDSLGQLNLIDGESNTQEIFQGSLHIPQRETQEWPFMINIPTHVDPRTIPEQHADGPEPSWPSIAETLPPSFEGSAYQTYARVEYWVQAILTLSGQAHSGRAVAILPILVSPSHPGPPIANMSMRYALKPHIVSSPRLARPSGPLSTSAKFKKIFQPRQAASLVFDMEVGFPSRIQLDNPEPIPFHLRAIPRWVHYDCTARDVSEPVKLKTVNLTVATHVHARNEGSSDSWTLKTILETKKAVATQYHGYEIPLTDDQGPLDIGREIDLKVKLEPAESFDKTYLRPAFQTPNIWITHSLKWAVSYEIAGKVLEAEASQAIEILPPSDDRPEEPVAPPPPYERSDSLVRPPKYDTSRSE